MKFRLYNGGGATNYAASQNAYSQRLPGQPYVSWKASDNNKTIVIAKSVKNDLPNNIKECTNNCGFIANPIKHNRKQYVSVNSNTTGFSNASLVGTLDKPGTNILTSMSCADMSMNQTMGTYILDTIDVTCKDKCFVIKRASTVIDNGYCASNKELLWKKCKTFNQNLPLTNHNTNLESFPDCDVVGNCTPYFYPSNKKYQVQGPVSSSARIAALKYGCKDSTYRRCYIPTTDYNRYGKQPGFDNTAEIPTELCCREKKKKSTIRIMS